MCWKSLVQGSRATNSKATVFSYPLPSYHPLFPPPSHHLLLLFFLLLSKKKKPLQDSSRIVVVAKRRGCSSWGKCAHISACRRCRPQGFRLLCRFTGEEGEGNTFPRVEGDSYYYYYYHISYVIFPNRSCIQGCMNNVTFGDTEISYYETVAGGPYASHPPLPPSHTTPIVPVYIAFHVAFLTTRIFLL